MTAKYGYIGYGPDTSPIVVAKQVFSPTGVQTNFTFAAGYQIGYLDVYLNGARQIEGQDFSATDTSTVGLSTAAQNGDVLELVAYKAYNLAAPTSVGSFAVGGNLTVSGNSAIVGNESVSTLIATTAIGIGSTYTTATTLPYPITITASGSTPTPSLSYCIADISSNQNGYSQFNLRNTNTGSSASGDLVITTDNGTDTTNFIDLGINNTGFNDAGWTVNGALDGYLYSSNTNLSVGVAFTNRYLSFFAGGTLAANEKIRVTSTGVGIGTTNTSNTLQVGTGITFTASGINVTGIVTATSLTVSQNATVGGALTVTGNLTVNGTQTIINTTSLEVADKNIGIGSTSSPTDALADGSGLTIYGTTDKTLTYNNTKKALETNVAWATTDTRLISVAEKLVRVNGNTVSLVYNTTGANIGFATNPTGDITLAVTGIPTSSDFDNHVLTFSVFVNQTGTARSCTSVTLNGVTSTIKFAGGSLSAAISGVTTTSGYDIYSFTGINTIGSASTTANYAVLGVVNGGFR
jgi:hypothetical protein